jgi:hypothetical protein
VEAVFLAEPMVKKSKFPIKQRKSRQKLKVTVKSMISNRKGGKSKAMAVGAYDVTTGKTTASFAGSIPSTIHPELIERAKRIGGIGSLGVTSKNTLGVCAEFHAVNNLLLRGADISNIRLTQPIRPRTGKHMPFCDNCKKMFSDLIDD